MLGFPMAAENEAKNDFSAEEICNYIDNEDKFLCLYTF